MSVQSDHYVQFANIAEDILKTLLDVLLLISNLAL